jgi:hypothetical protein
MRSVVENLPAAATVDIAVVRGGTALTLAGPATAATTADPPAVGCGRISSFDVAPRGEHLYGARILLLDGSTPGPGGTPSFRVGPGEHQLLVAENIPTQAHGLGEIATLRRHTSKPLTVVVQPGRTAMVAAQLHLANASDITRGAYWEPVVWRQAEEACP